MNLLSERIANLEESATIAMATKAREYKERGIQIINLSLGEPDFPTPKFINEAAKQAIDSGKYFTYPPVPGYLDLREALAQKLQKENGIKCTAACLSVKRGKKRGRKIPLHESSFSLLLKLPQLRRYAVPGTRYPVQ